MSLLSVVMVAMLTLKSVKVMVMSAMVMSRVGSDVH